MNAPFTSYPSDLGGPVFFDFLFYCSHHLPILLQPLASAIPETGQTCSCLGAFALTVPLSRMLIPLKSNNSFPNDILMFIKKKKASQDNKQPSVPEFHLYGSNQPVMDPKYSKDIFHLY
jgi:hypothetical protein